MREPLLQILFERASLKLFLFFSLRAVSIARGAARAFLARLARMVRALVIACVFLFLTKNVLILIFDFPRIPGNIKHTITSFPYNANVTFKVVCYVSQLEGSGGFSVSATAPSRPAVNQFQTFQFRGTYSTGAYTGTNIPTTTSQNTETTLTKTKTATTKTTVGDDTTGGTTTKPIATTTTPIATTTTSGGTTTTSGGTTTATSNVIDQSTATSMTANVLLAMITLGVFVVVN